MSMRRAIAVMLLLGLVFPSMARATDDETAMGVYSYKSDSLRLKFTMDLDGVRDLRINGHSFRSPIQMAEAPGSGQEKSYTFHVVDKGVAKIVTLFILFDSDSAVRAVSGFYFEQAREAELMTHVITFKPTFHRLSLDKLPSGKGRG